MKATIKFSEKLKSRTPKLNYPMITEEERILFVGDTSFGDNYLLEYARRKDIGFNILERYGRDYFFQKVKSLLFDVDTVIANLETPLINKELTNKPSFYFSSKNPYGNKLGRYQHWSDGKRTVEYLKKYNILTVSLANNHMLDYGIDGLNQTISTLGNEGIRFFGANENARSASIPFKKSIFVGNRNLKLVVISAFENRKAYDVDFAFYAGKQKAGVNRLSINKIRDKIQNLRQREQSYEVFVVAYPHWGRRRNYGWKTNSQKRIGHQLIDAGADIVIGHGPHNLQEIEVYKGHLIFNSIGNFMYNTLGNYNKYNAIPYSLAVELIFRIEDKATRVFRNKPNEISGNFTEFKKFIKLYPILTENHLTNFQTRPLDHNEFDIVYRLLIQKNPDLMSPKWHIKTGIDKIGPYFELSLN